VLLTFTVGAGVIGSTLAALLTAAVAVSMALTPLAMILYERVAAMMDAAIPKVPDTGDFEDGEPDIIIAGFGRFGQITGRLLTANGFRSTVLDSDIEQIDLLRRFGRRVHYGDATRMDLLRAAGIERARMLIVALDDREKTVELVETARKAFPDLVILARAWDRRHAYDLLANGADAVERETFEAALSLGPPPCRSWASAPTGRTGPRRSSAATTSAASRTCVRSGARKRPISWPRATPPRPWTSCWPPTWRACVRATAAGLGHRQPGAGTARAGGEGRGGVDQSSP
jgi:hypothetical protein